MNLTYASGPTLWQRQAGHVIREELRRSVSWRSVWLLGPALAPVFVVLMHAIKDRGGCSLVQETQILAAILQLYYVRFAIFFGCLGLSMQLLRGQIAEKTLHYPFLAPIRREVLIVGKFLGGVLASTLLFGSGVLALFGLMYWHFPEGHAFVQTGAGLAHLRGYLLVTTLACLGYSAVFLAFGLLFKNPGIPAMVMLLWETINGVLPGWLKHLSVTFYLKPLFPVELPLEGLAGLLSVVVEPTPPWLATLGLVLFAAIVLAFVCWRIRRFEVSYTLD